MGGRARVYSTVKLRFFLTFVFRENSVSFRNKGQCLNGFLFGISFAAF